MAFRARSTDPLDYQRVPRPVAAMAKDFANGHVIAPHSHERAQLIHAIAGVMTVTSAAGAWAVPPHRALWMPAGVEHTLRMSGAVSMRTLYIRADAAPGLPAACRVIAVSPLLRELILRAADLPVLYDEGGPAGRIMALILDEIRSLPELPLSLPTPADPRLAPICRALLADPADDRPLDAWARAAGASGRTLARLFRTETGLTFGAWRQQARLLEAMARLAAGESVTAVALDLGYDSPSAFGAMFRRALGAPPSRYIGAGRAP